MKISIDDKEYPDRLRKIKNPPKQLYVEGNIELLNSPGISVIGSRGNTKYGERMTKKFVKDLSLYGLTIISGMAKGIDGIAHSSCLEVGGNTIAVLPCGFKNIYPKQNMGLYKNILNNNGLVVTEYEEDVKAYYNTFLERNRIVSGLSIGTLVIEGGYRSGTSVTANLSKKAGIKVFCVPSSLENEKGITPNKLIKDGAFLVMEVEDIINQYPELSLTKKEIGDVCVEDESVNEEYRVVYDVLDNKKLMNVNEIIKKTKLDISEVSYKLMMLELDDKIVTMPGHNYRKK